ncbi:MAG: hypothetical protein IJZ59_05845 [Alphaproteobacteria bacterium]|nr:hypothetical protein [Alphaproteobacteria bacterium]
MMSEFLKSYSAVFGDGSCKTITLGATINRGGAAGKIVEVKEHPELVAKIFHNLSKSSTNREKLQAMLLNRPSFSPALKNGKEFIMKGGEKYIQIAWPEALLENEEGYCVGYLMPRIELSLSASLDHFMQRATRQKLGLSENYEYRIRIACNLSSMVAALHEKGHYIVDLKPSNVYVYKESMLISMLDCDGFSIKGEKNRYPAEFVSEEYIYPEGMSQSCDEMGEEQDKFALAVIIFKLLNNGIHPFSGTPRKQKSPTYTIQERITQYHYAYGSWGDAYQDPHPYSIHDSFTPETLELFDRAFVKGLNRPTAQEWEKHLRKLLSNVRRCKKNPNHVYFTSKGCGLCLMENKIKDKLSSVRKEHQKPQTIRGVSIDELSQENVEKNKIEQQKKIKKYNKIAAPSLLLYMLLWSFMYPILKPISDKISNIGIGLQIIIIILLTAATHYVLKKTATFAPILSNIGLRLAVLIYTFICALICIWAINDIPIEALLLIK